MFCGIALTRVRWLILQMCICLPSGAVKADQVAWYKTESHHCAGNASVAADIPIFNFDRSETIGLTSNGSGSFFVSIAISAVPSEKGEDKFSSVAEFEIENTSQAGQLQSSLKDLIADMKIPWVFDQGLDLLLSGFWSLAGDAVWGAYADNLKEKHEAVIQEVRDLSAVVAAGGKLTELAGVKRNNDGKTFLRSMLIYSVLVGSERRVYFLGSCLYALAPIVTKFVTTGGMNDKTLRLDAGGWQYIDNDSGAGREFTFAGQDSEYYYFDDPENIDRHYRISMFGGPMQRDSGSGWESLYVTSTAS